MKEKILLFSKNPLILGSSIIFIGTTLASLINYLFNLAMGRMLSVSDYGVFASLVSMFNISSVFALTIIIVFSKLSASLVARKKQELIGSLIVSGNLWVGLMAIIACGFLAVLSFKISEFLKIQDNIYVLITIASIFFWFIASVASGILQGLLKFVSFSLVNILSSVIKLIVGITFVFLGGKVIGAISAFLFSVISSYIFYLFPLFDFFKKRKVEGSFTLLSLHSNAFSYAVPVFLSSIGITAFISLDIILVKHYFSAQAAGQYAALSLMGRVIWFVVAPISSVLFPLIAQKKERKEELTGTLILSLILVSIPASLLSLFYFAFPEFVLKVFFPATDYAVLKSYLGLFSVFILLYCLSFLLNSFYLSIGKTKVFILTSGAAVIEAVFIILWHGNITEIIYDLIGSSLLLLLSLLIFFKLTFKSHASS